MEHSNAREAASTVPVRLGWLHASKQLGWLHSPARGLYELHMTISARSVVVYWSREFMFVSALFVKSCLKCEAGRVLGSYRTLSTLVLEKCRILHVEH
jgi:hypothetical protein